MTPAAMSGPSNTGNIANSGRNSGSENIGGTQATNSRPAPPNLPVSPLSGSGSQRGSSSGPSFLHPQFSSLQGMTSNIPVMHSSIQHSSIVPYPQSAAAVGGGGKPNDMKTSAGHRAKPFGFESSGLKPCQCYSLDIPNPPLFWFVVLFVGCLHLTGF